MRNVCNRFDILFKSIQIIYLGDGCQQRILVYIPFIFADINLMVLVDGYKIDFCSMSLVCKPYVIHGRKFHICHDHFFPFACIVKGIGYRAHKVGYGRCDCNLVWFSAYESGELCFRKLDLLHPGIPVHAYASPVIQISLYAGEHLLRLRALGAVAKVGH